MIAFGIGCIIGLGALAYVCWRFYKAMNHSE